MIASTAELARLIDIVDRMLEDLPSFSWDHRAAYDAAVGAALKRLEKEHGAQCRQHSSNYEHSIRLGGIRSTSTSGWTSALHNWRAAAARKVGK